MTVYVGLGTLSGQVQPGGTPSDSYQNIIRLAIEAEEAGFDSVWVSEHHGTHNAHMPSPLVALAAIAASTGQIRIGSGIALAPFQHPLRFAEDCAVVDQISGGRLTVGIGPGWRREEFETFGVPRTERGLRTEELAQICRAAWTGRRFSHHGTHFRYDDVLVTPPPTPEIRLFMVGVAPAAIARAARLGDGFIANGIPQIGITELTSRVQLLDTKARQAGRDPADITVCFAVNGWASHEGTPPGSLLDAMWRRIGASVAWHAGVRLSDDKEIPQADVAEIRRRAWMGTPAEIIGEGRKWLEPFADRDVEVIFRLQFPGMAFDAAVEQVRLFGREIAPALRELADDQELPTSVITR